MNRRRRIYEGKAKILYEGPEPGTLVQHFKDDATAFNNKKHDKIEGKGVLNNRISEYLFQKLGEIGVPTHFIKRLNMREQLIREVEIIPLEVVVRNVAAGSLSTRLGIDEGTALPRSIVEFYYKNDKLDDPMVTEEHITAFGWATPQEIDDVMSLALRINDFLSGLFLGVGIRLVDFKCEFGRLWENEHDAHRAGRRDLAGLLPAVGHRDAEQARQGPLPPRHGRAGRGLSGGRAAARAACRQPDADAHRPGAGALEIGQDGKGDMKARITITLKPGVLDPQGKAIAGALHALGFGSVGNVRQGKYIEVEVAENDPGRARAEVERMCEQLLANTIIENYAYELEAA